MPISEFQAEILRCIAANRSPESFLAGATVLHRDKKSPRYSKDLDLFHDVEQSVASSAEKDAETLVAAGYELDWMLRTPSFFRAVVRKEDKRLRIEWAHDSAFRFFPVEEDVDLGFRLHAADAATNKVLALAGRSEVRDFVDVLHLHETYLSLGALAWAACGKDAGFTPDFLLEQVARHSAYTQADLDRLQLREPLDIRSLKKKWLAMLETSRELVRALPAEDMGCLYLAAGQAPIDPDPDSERFRDLVRHRGSVRGAWPVVSETPANS
ncbi:nucleotidyl transferase AbiEii/AbiGii toxin family protein [Haloferula sp. A504]|uniref:nucleotidyl transferase AbiEii/AbiGii toxin family protein n=1 Tax=Haloferula sp. A504 TaxID=3373601 RepID=UPI0031C058C6|nr:nucleotidyl transferase AbiEii/AbiGii toxin family protein [Verrucomicrobiaceae bacterium E54]